MPSVSPKQHRFMEAVAHNPQFAREAGVPQSVGQEFAKADEAKASAPPSPHALRLAHALRNHVGRNPGGY